MSGGVVLALLLGMTRRCSECRVRIVAAATAKATERVCGPECRKRRRARLARRRRRADAEGFRADERKRQRARRQRLIRVLLGLRRRLVGARVLVVRWLLCAKHLDDALEGQFELLARRTLRMIGARLLIRLLVAREIRLLQFAELRHLRKLLEQLIASTSELGDLLLESPDKLSTVCLKPLRAADVPVESADSAAFVNPDG